MPTVHANFRHLTHGSKSWFGGGADLTPYYPFKEDVIHFHKTWKRVCDQHAAVANYATMKHECDEYFFLKHRQEARGVGGIFFDYIDATEPTFDFVRDAGDAFLEAYVPIVEKRKGLAFTPEQRFFQEVRRGRYVEFNLVYDRGTIFGLKTDGRTESILMSLPPVVRYVYDYQARARLPRGRADRVLAEAARLGGDGRERCRSYPISFKRRNLRLSSAIDSFPKLVRLMPRRSDLPACSAPGSVLNAYSMPRPDKSGRWLSLN